MLPTVLLALLVALSNEGFFAGWLPPLLCLSHSETCKVKKVKLQVQPWHIANHMYSISYSHKIASIVSTLRAGNVPLFPLTVLPLNSSSVNSSSIKKRRTRVGCRFDLRSMAAKEELLIKTPMCLTSSIFWTGIWCSRNGISSISFGIFFHFLDAVEMSAQFKQFMWVHS